MERRFTLTGELTHHMGVEVHADHTVRNFMKFGHHRLGYLGNGVRPDTGLLVGADRVLY